MHKNRLKTALKSYLEQEVFLGEDENASTPGSVGSTQKNNTADVLKAFEKEISGCLKCPLGKTRIKFVFGVGDPRAKLMFVGEGPGFDEDRMGEPFVGAAGKLLDKMIQAIGMSRDTVYIANVVKCHPMKDPLHPERRGNDRPPSEDEAAECLPYLARQIQIIKPRVICTLGGSATKSLLNTSEAISRMRGQRYDYQGILVIPTFHPAALLRDPSYKKKAWEDLQKVRDACNNQ